MGWQATMRAMAAAERRQQRDAKKRQRELERQAKEMAKLSALEQARLEVETFENGLDVLLSIWCGNLVYTRRGLFAVFTWLLWGEFCFTPVEGVVPSILPLKLKRGWTPQTGRSG